MREYVITLHNHKELDSFYEDMETPGGSLYIPDREVPVEVRRPVSRSTHYRLTDEEAEMIRHDPRVLAVELSMEEQGIEFHPIWTRTSTYWDKSSFVSSLHKNWGLLRCTEGTQRPSWGSNGISAASGEVTVNPTGKNVDVVVVDGHMNPSHPEFAVNADGTGGTRVNQYNWFELDPDVSGNPAGTYVYTPYVDPTYPDNNGDGYSDRTLDNDHGCHVAGTLAGNSLGWAADATIYNISPYASSPSSTGYFIDYIKVWHQSKPINPLTGIKNPTITNHSYGVSYKIAISSISSVRYGGSTISGPFTSLQLQNYGVVVSGSYAYIPARVTSIEQDFIDLIAAGVIVVGAAGNSYTKINNYSGNISDDYNNYISTGFYDYYYLRGSITAAEGVICVGAIGSYINDSKADFSNCGPRIDLYAPGRYIMSSINSSIGIYSNDSRNSAYHITKYSGTSMASPQVAGVVACLAEIWPTMKQDQVVKYLHNFAKTGQITSGTGGPKDYFDLQGSENRYLYFNKERPSSGQVGPKTNFGNRPESGQAWPRTKIFRYGR